MDFFLCWLIGLVFTWVIVLGVKWCVIVLLFFIFLLRDRHFVAFLMSAKSCLEGTHILTLPYSWGRTDVFTCCLGFDVVYPDGLAGKESACNAGGCLQAGDPGSIPGSGNPLEKEMATHSSIPAWKIPWTEKPQGIQSTGSQRVQHDWAHMHARYLPPEAIYFWFWLTG